MATFPLHFPMHGKGWPFCISGQFLFEWSVFLISFWQLKQMPQDKGKVNAS